MLTFPDGTIYDLRDETPSPPAPLPEQPVGFIPPAGSRMAVVFGMDYDGNMAYTNDTISAIQTYKDGVVYPHDYQTIKMEYYREWLGVFEQMNNSKLLGLWVQPRYGWCDKDAPETDPWEDDVHYNVIDCGLNRREVVAEVVKNGIKYAVIRMVPIDNVPRVYDWEREPQLCQIQTAINNAETWWRSPEQGRVIWPNWAKDELIAYNLSHCVYYPALPFFAKVHGYDVIVAELCYSGSKTYGNLTGELEGWYLLDEIVPPADLVEPFAVRTDRDYVCHIEADGWPGLKGKPLPPECPWRKL